MKEFSPVDYSKNCAGEGGLNIKSLPRKRTDPDDKYQDKLPDILFLLFSDLQPVASPLFVSRQ